MSAALPVVTLVRHGETAWTVTKQHTGLSDLPLTERGEADARRLGARLRGQRFAKVWTSPLARAARTCELAGFAAVAERDADLVEWDYGKYEGRTSAEILAERPGWSLFRDGCPGGETPAHIAARADRVLGRVRGCGADVLLFSSAHFLRVLTARWLGLEVGAAALFVLGTATLSRLAYEHGLAEPVVALWNECPP
ncbi:MAG TPA: histidine phosphatase family protein [Myxococcota bacterium]|nr:histidine phosphatase family protein [Myxococcota bacterium]